MTLLSHLRDLLGYLKNLSGVRDYLVLYYLAPIITNHWQIISDHTYIEFHETNLLTRKYHLVLLDWCRLEIYAKYIKSTGDCNTRRMRGTFNRSCQHSEVDAVGRWTPGGKLKQKQEKPNKNNNKMIAVAKWRFQVKLFLCEKTTTNCTRDMRS